MFEFLPPVWRCGHAMQRGYLQYFKISKKKFVRQGGGVVSGGVAQDRYKVGTR